MKRSIIQTGTGGTKDKHEILKCHQKAFIALNHQK